MALPVCSCGGRFLWVLGFDGWVALCYRCGLRADEFLQRNQTAAGGEPVPADTREAPGA